MLKAYPNQPSNDHQKNNQIIEREPVKRNRSKNVGIHPPRYANKTYFDDQNIIQRATITLESIELYDYLNRFGIENVKKGGSKISINSLIQILLEYIQDEIQLQPDGFRSAEEIIEKLNQLRDRK